MDVCSEADSRAGSVDAAFPTSCGMNTISSNFDFLEDEFVQAGLLPDSSCVLLTGSAALGPQHASANDVIPEQNSHLPAGITALLRDGQQAQQPCAISRQEPLPRQEVIGGSVDKRQSNRVHQKRFRERQKVRAQAIETQLAKTTQDLARLKLQQQELQNRLVPAAVQALISPEPGKHEADMAQMDREVVEGPPLNVTLPGRECVLTVADVGNMPAQQFNALWQGYVRELQSCTDAVQAQVHISDRAGSRLAQLVWEAMRLKCQHLLTHVQHSLLSRPDMTDNPALYLISIFDLTDRQIQDLMFLRRVFLLKQHELKLQQAALVGKVQNKTPALLGDVTRVANLANQLRLNAAQCHLLVQRLCWAIYLGVFTMKQAAQVLIHSDINSILAETILHRIAEQQGLPSKQSILRSAHERLTMQDWTRFWQYTETINPYILLSYDYVPIPAVHLT